MHTLSGLFLLTRNKSVNDFIIISLPFNALKAFISEYSLLLGFFFEIFGLDVFVLVFIFALAFIVFTFYRFIYRYAFTVFETYLIFLINIEAGDDIHKHVIY
jgi:hypothetical protein